MRGYFRFEYIGYMDALEGETQANAEGCRVSFDVYIGVKKKGALHVDLVVGVATTDDVVIESPAHALDLPKLPSSDYRLYPIVDQIADKVCATLAQAVTSTDSGHPLVEQLREEHPLDAAAARAAVRAVELMNNAHAMSELSTRGELAEAAGVSEGRISQLLNGDGDARVSRLARLLEASGFDLELAPREGPRPRATLVA